jgi:crossover junction endodeoxyribonuclease RuvC
MNIIAFDLSMVCTGYSIFRNDGLFIETGHIDTNGKLSTPLRLRKISIEMNKLKKIFKPKLILIEKGFYRFAGSTEQIFRVHGITNLIFYNVPQVELHATSVRKLVTGKGNIKKEEMEIWIQEKYPNINFRNNDEVDSFALGMAYFNQEGLT